MGQAVHEEWDAKVVKINYRKTVGNLYSPAVQGLVAEVSAGLSAGFSAPLPEEGCCSLWLEIPRYSVPHEPGNEN